MEVGNREKNEPRVTQTKSLTDTINTPLSLKDTRDSKTQAGSGTLAAHFVLGKSLCRTFVIWTFSFIIHRAYLPTFSLTKHICNKNRIRN